jgi:hypothetical protein
MFTRNLTTRTAFFAEKPIFKPLPRNRVKLGQSIPVKQVTFSGMGVMTFVALIISGLVGGFGLERWEQWRAKRP